MAVTKSVRSLTLVAFTSVLLIGFQNCSVDLAGTTPGASTFNCAPTAPELTSFQNIEQNILTSTGLVNGKSACGNCHMSGGAGSGRYDLKANSPVDPALTLTNYCTTALKGANGMNILFNSHAGGAYSPSDVPDLADFITEYLQ